MKPCMEATPLNEKSSGGPGTRRCCLGGEPFLPGDLVRVLMSEEDDFLPPSAADFVEAKAVAVAGAGALLVPVPFTGARAPERCDAGAAAAVVADFEAAGGFDPAKLTTIVYLYMCALFVF